MAGSMLGTKGDGLAVMLDLSADSVSTSNTARDIIP